MTDNRQTKIEKEKEAKRVIDRQRKNLAMNTFIWSKIKYTYTYTIQIHLIDQTL